MKRSEQEQLAREMLARAEQKVAGEIEDCTPTSHRDNEDDGDAEMHDVSDSEAVFKPTEDQPYHRPRRYTIT